MAIWKRAVVDRPPCDASLVSKYVKGDIHICNGKTIGPPIGFAPVGWAVRLERQPTWQLTPPPPFRCGIIESITFGRGIKPLPYNHNEWISGVTNLQHVMQMPYHIDVSYHESDNSLLKTLFDNWLGHVYNDLTEESLEEKLTHGDTAAD